MKKPLFVSCRECQFQDTTYMPYTSGMTQPATTAPLIVDKSNVAKGLASRFLWIFLKPVFNPFLAIKVPPNKYEGLSPPISCFKLCYEEPVCYHFP